MCILNLMRKISCVFGLFLVSIGALSAQVISIGVIGGAPLTDYVSNHNPGNFNQPCSEGCANNGGTYSIGPSVRVNLPSGLRVEADALYRPFGVTSFGGDGFAVSLSGQEWRFPVLLQYRFRGELLRPFIEGGLSLDHIGALSGTANWLKYGRTVSHTSAAGLVFGAGVDVGVHLLSLSAEVRYTREATSYFEGASNLNQAAILFGVRF